jgi:hypothetical protein
MKDRQIVAITPLPCAGQTCLDATRAMIEQALSSPSSAPD